MSYELKAILEYDAARREIKDLTRDIGFEGHKRCAQEGTQCLDSLWHYNIKAVDADECGETDDLGPAPKLCRRCAAVEEKVQLRKAAKKRFGIAKVRLSRIALEHKRSTQIITSKEPT